MIQPNELRIKNIIKNPRYFKEWGQHLYQTVECICGKDISTNKDDWDADYLEPVELTPDILEAAGFKKAITRDYCERYFIGENPVTHDWLLDLLWLHSEKFPFYRNGHHKIKYLHQLQNLYYCLTREELQIDITKLNKEK